MDSKTLSSNMHTFYDSLDDKTLQDFSARGPAALDDDAIQRYYHAVGFKPPQETAQVQSASQETAFGIPVSKVVGVPVADWTVPVANWLKSNAADPLKQSGQEASDILGNGYAGKFVKGSADLGASLIPQTPGQVKLQVGLPLAAEGLGTAASAVAKTPVGQTAINYVAPTIQALSRLSAPLVEKVLNSPSILSRALGVDEAGQVMSKFFGQLGLKSGSEALQGASEEMGKAAPTLGNFQPIADKVVEDVRNMPQTLHAMDALEGQIHLVSQEAQEGGLAAYGGQPSASQSQAIDTLNNLKSQYQKLQFQLPNAQDAIVARQYLSKIAQKQAFQSAENQVVTPVAQNSLSLIDNYLDNEVDRITTEAFKSGKPLDPINVPGYGDVTTPQQVRDIYHEAKIGEAFSNVLPVNKNGQPDALRAVMALLLKNPKALLMSPKLWGMGIQGAEALANPSTMLKTAQTVTGAQNLFSQEGQQ